MKEPVEFGTRRIDLDIAEPVLRKNPGRVVGAHASCAHDNIVSAAVKFVQTAAKLSQRDAHSAGWTNYPRGRSLTEVAPQETGKSERMIII